MADEPKTIAEINAELATLNAANGAEKERIKLLNDRKAALADIAAIINKEELPYLKNSLETSKALVDIEKDKSKKLELTLEIKKQEFELAKKNLLQAKILGNVNDEELKKLEEAFEKTKKLYEQDKLRLDVAQKTNEVVKKGFSFLLDNTIGKAYQYGLDFFKEALDAQQKMAQYGKPDILNSKNYDALNSKFTEFGVGLKEMTDSTIALDKSFAAFSNLNKSLQNDLAGTAAKMVNLGISADEQGKHINEFSRGLGMGAQKASAELYNISVQATRAGVSPQKAIADLGSSFGQLSSNGSKTTKVFVELMKSSKELGIEVSSMLSVVGKGFDTFEGAAEKAGSLNSILGGDYLNSVEMLNATEDERVKLMRDAFQQSGKNFDQLDRFTKKSITAALGFKDEAEARKMLGHVSSEQRLKLQSEEKAQEQLQKAQKQSVDTSRMLQMAFYDLMKIMQPLAESFRRFVTFLAEHRHAVMTVVTAIGVLYGAFKLLSIVKSIGTLFNLTGGIFKIFGMSASLAGEGAKNGVEKMGQGIGNAAKSASSAIPVMLAFGGAVALIGIGIGAAAWGLSALAKSFKDLNKEQIDGFNSALINLSATFIVFIATLGLIALSPIGEAAAIALLAIGAAIALIGAGVMLAAVGMSLLVKTIQSLVKDSGAGQIKSVFFDLALGIGALLVAFAGLVAIGATPFGFLGIGAGIAAFVTIIKGLKAAIEELPETTEFKAKVDVLKIVSETIKSSSNVNADKIKPAKDFIDSAKSYYDAQRTSKDASQDALVQALTKAMSNNKETGKQESGETKITLVVDGQNFIGKLVDSRKVIRQGT